MKPWYSCSTHLKLFCCVSDVQHCSYHSTAQRFSLNFLSKQILSCSPQDPIWCCSESPGPVQIVEYSTIYAGRKKCHLHAWHLQQNHYLSPESSSVKRFPAIPVLHIQACPLVKQYFSCMQITIGCSYMQLGDKEQSISHLQGLPLGLCATLRWNLLDNLRLDLDRWTIPIWQMPSGQEQVIPVADTWNYLHVILFGEETAWEFRTYLTNTG